MLTALTTQDAQGGNFMGMLDWATNRMAGGAKLGVVTLTARTSSGISAEIAKYARKGYVLQGGITTSPMYGGNSYKYHATMMLVADNAEQQQQQSPESAELDDELKKIEIERKKLELEKAKLELEKQKQAVEDAKTPEQKKQEAEAKRKQEEAEEQARVDKIEKGKAKLKLAGSLMLGPLGLVSSKNRQNIKNSLDKLMKK